MPSGIIKLGQLKRSIGDTDSELAKSKVSIPRYPRRNQDYCKSI